MNSVVIFVLLCVAAVYSQSSQQFQADITIKNDPNVVGTMTGIIDYDYTGQRQSIRYSFGSSGGPQEIILFASKLRYLVCTGTCDAESWQEAQHQFFRNSGESPSGGSITVGSRTCTGYTKPASTGPVRTVYVDGSGIICRADYANGKQITFSNPRAVDAARFNDYNGKGCPQQQCGKMIDFVLVLDESGSISPTSFRYMKTFAGDLANAYTFGPLAAAMGIVMFSSSSRVVLNINSDDYSVKSAIASLQQQDGNTCLGCGIQRGHQMFIDYRRTGAQMVMIFMTDGQNNRQTSQFPTVRDAAKAYGIIIFSIGVGSVDQDECRSIASTIPGVTTYFYTPSYQQLGTILDQLVIVTCVDIPGNPCGSGCKGFCSCGKTCICPSTCDDNNRCTNDLCAAGTNGAGCYYTAFACSDSNACTEDRCDPVNGCYYPNVTCSTADRCKDVSCDVNIGCQYKNKNCDDGSPCTSDSCVSATGCRWDPIPCDLCQFPQPKVCPDIPCKINECDPGTGDCVATNISCSDGLVCSVDSCNPATGQCVYTPLDCDDGDMCTIDFCSEVVNGTVRVGCNNVPVNATEYCNDQNVCTDDVCIPSYGCNNTQINCDDGLFCTVDTCNSILGCQYAQKDCSGELPALTGNCYSATCDEDLKCYAKELPGRKIDKCGVCDGDGKCGVTPETAAGIAAGVLAAIIIGAIVVCAVLGAIGGKKGYDIYMRNKNNMTGANTNPLYHDNGLSGTNPMYTDADSRL